MPFTNVYICFEKWSPFEYEEYWTVEVVICCLFMIQYAAKSEQKSMKHVSTYRKMNCGRALESELIIRKICKTNKLLNIPSFIFLFREPDTATVPLKLARSHLLRKPSLLAFAWTVIGFSSRDCTTSFQKSAVTKNLTPCCTSLYCWALSVVGTTKKKRSDLA